MRGHEETVMQAWDQVGLRLANERQEVFRRILPLFNEARKRSFLSKLFPYISHEYLCFSLTAYPWTDNFPCIRPIPNIIEFNILVAINRITDPKTTISLIQPFLNKYPFILEKKPSCLVVNDAQELIDLSDPTSAVNWILEQTREMYVVFGKGVPDLQDSDILDISNIPATLDLLFERIHSVTSFL